MSERRRPVELLPDGSLLVILAPEEVALLRQLGDELQRVYAEGEDRDPVRERLFPRAYLDPTEDEAEAEWEALIGPDLLRTRLDALVELAADLDAGTRHGSRMHFTLAADAVQRWLAVLNDARLALGVRLEITDDTDYLDPRPDDPNATALMVYGWLSAFQGALIDVLLGDFDPLDPLEDLTDD